ncbi:MarR family winged helix-turn-helix transcriptional regulator [Nocardioides acrostichi]|uniref:MarR family transcriptional regulator n=1 Tax=Nocardioides acrostichi TaxID=2784339 RepID=A0A930UZF0_9ACTN|nr:MarR family transcriptional regulator [Nocardioides acrostichi]MBF4163728.1 MarR family transcriptional regulator [Nocardioides acrostichi]
MSTSGDDQRAVLLPVLGRLPGHLLWRAHARSLAVMAEVLPPDIDLHAHAVLLALDDGAPRSQRELADLVVVSRTSMTATARVLDECGLVRRERNPADRRSYALTLTEAGRRARQAWQPHVQRLDAALTRGLSAQETDELRGLLRRAAASDLAPDTPAPLRDSVGFLVSRLKFRAHRLFSTALRSHGIEPQHFATLAAVRELGPVPQSELARAIGMSPPSIVLIADELGERGLLTRERLAADRRTQMLHLSESAGPLLDHALGLAADLGAEALAPLDSDEIARLVVLLRRLVTR